MYIIQRSGRLQAVSNKIRTYARSVREKLNTRLAQTSAAFEQTISRK